MVVPESIQANSSELVPATPEVIVPPPIVYPPLAVKSVAPLTTMPPLESNAPVAVLAMFSVTPGFKVLTCGLPDCTTRELIVLLAVNVV